jgi:uncharacterized protein
LANSLAVITGASSGIGTAFARKLAPHYDLLLIARREDLLAALAAELAAKYCSAVEVIAADLTDGTKLSLVSDRIAAEPGLALLVNNAGFGMRGAFWEADLGILEKMQRLHVMATVRLSHAALRGMVARDRGAIINVASVSAFVRSAGSVSYGATKSWIAAFTEGLYLDLKRANSAVKVQALCPGYTYSGFHDIMSVDRQALASSSFWMTADEVVDNSLKALSRGKLIVIPGWRYKVIVSVLTRLPTSMRLLLESGRPSRKR